MRINRAAWLPMQCSNSPVASRLTASRDDVSHIGNLSRREEASASCCISMDRRSHCLLSFIDFNSCCSEPFFLFSPFTLTNFSGQSSSSLFLVLTNMLLTSQ